MIRGSSENKAQKDELFDKAIDEVIDSIAGYKQIKINSYRIDADNVITINFTCNNEEMVIYFAIEYVEYVLRKYNKELKSTENKSNANRN